MWVVLDFEISPPPFKRRTLKLGKWLTHPPVLIGGNTVLQNWKLHPLARYFILIEQCFCKLANTSVKKSVFSLRFYFVGVLLLLSQSETLNKKAYWLNSCYWSLSIPTENNRKPEVLFFRGYKKRRVVWIGSKPLVIILNEKNSLNQ